MQVILAIFIMFSPRSLSSRISSIHTLLALAAIIFIYHIFPTVVDTTYSFRTQRQQQHPLISEHIGIPKIIWYKLGPHGLSDDAKNWTDSCITNNPDYRAKFMTDSSGDEYVQKHFASRPDIVQNYLALTVPIFKADLLRYLLLYNQGGIWSDLDVSCEDVPIDEWMPNEYKNNASLVVGWEFDVGWGKPFIRQFTSWTIMAKPRSPHMMQVIDDILQTLRETTLEKNVAVENATVEMFGDVVDFSGPRRLTRSVYTSLRKALNRTVGEQDMEQILRPKLMGDVLVMLGRSFADSSNMYRPEQEEVLPPKLVTHHYAGSWKNSHGGEARDTGSSLAP